MFPFRDHNPSSTTPYVTWTLIAMNVIIFLYYVTSPTMQSEMAITQFFYQWGMRPAAIADGTQVYTLLTSMFLHASILHLLGNLLFLYIYGDNVEDRLGHFKFALFYIATGLSASGLHIATSPASEIPTVGASGAVSGVMGAYLLLFPKARIDIAVILVIFVRVFTVPAYIVLSFWILFQIINGLANIGYEGAGVAHWAHIGGFFTGVILILPVWRRLGGPEFWKKSLFMPPNAPTFETRTTTIPIVKRKKKR